eukprot:1756205-Rhodomonas_salina.1
MSSSAFRWASLLGSAPPNVGLSSSLPPCRAGLGFCLVVDAHPPSVLPLFCLTLRFLLGLPHALCHGCCGEASPDSVPERPSEREL